MNVGWLAVAMGAAALVVGGYIVFLYVRKARLERELGILRKRGRRN